MTSRADLARLLAVGLCAFAVGYRLNAAFAQTQVAAMSPPQAAAVTPARTWSTVNFPDQPVYRDHYIGGGSLAPDISAGDTGTGSDDGEGLARSVQIDAVASVLSARGAGTDSNMVEDGIVAKAQWETAQYGAWSLDASARAQSSDAGPSEQGQGGVLTLRQRGMPFDGGWQADNAIGDLNAPDISLARLQTALLSAHWSHAGRNHGVAWT